VSEQVFHRSSHVLARSFGEEVLLASPEKEEVDRLVGPAAAVWELLATPQSATSLMAELAVTYRTSPIAIGDDVQVLLKDLDARGWIEGTTLGDR
jgi:hypothetical protein